MNQKSSYINIEDVLFSSILGAYLGTFINNLGVFYISLLVAFFVLFPVLLKLLESKSRYALVSANLVGILLFVWLLLYLLNNKLITGNQNAGILVIFLGWVISINISSVMNLIRLRKEEDFDLKMESIPVEGIRGIIFLVSDYKRKVEIEEDFDLQQSLLYKIMAYLNGNQNNISHIWFVHEDAAEQKGSSAFIARELKDLYKSNFEIKKATIENPFDTHDTFKTIRKIFVEAKKDSKLKEQEIICDSTGGTKPMSIGASLACAGNRKLVYCKQDGNDTWNFLQVNKTISKTGI